MASARNDFERSQAVATPPPPACSRIQEKLTPCIVTTDISVTTDDNKGNRDGVTMGVTTKHFHSTIQ